MIIWHWLQDEVGQRKTFGYTESWEEKYQNFDFGIKRLKLSIHWYPVWFYCLKLLRVGVLILTGSGFSQGCTHAHEHMCARAHGGGRKREFGNF